MIFIDTGALLGRYLTNDQYHHTANEKWGKIQKNNDRCFTSNFVLDETFTLLARKASYSFSAEKAKTIYASDFFTILRPDHQEELEAIELFEKYADQQISYTDCISFILMNKKKIKFAFSFDRHFSLAGFKLL